MKKVLFVGVLVAAVLAVTACGKKAEDVTIQNTEETTVAQTEAAAETEVETAVEEETADDAQAESPAATYTVYESENGWKIEYNPQLFAVNEETDQEIMFVYQGECAGTNAIGIKYYPDKMPNEVLYELTEGVEDDKVDRSEGYFGGTYPNWSYSRHIAPGDEGSGLGENYTAIEHNGGTLVVDIIYHRETDEEQAMEVSDNLAGVVDSLEFTDHKPQEELAYVIGTFVREYKEEIEGVEDTYTDTIELRDDHTGMMSFQDDIDIIWSSYELICVDSNARYEYKVEGDTLYVNLDGDWMEFERK